MKINDNLAFLRKQRGITQEEAAQAFHVSNQAVSKWESGNCCPDMELIPDICRFYGVSADWLLGMEEEKQTYEQVYDSVRRMFVQSDREKTYSLAAALAGLLHEACTTCGYREEARWNTEKRREPEENGSWGYSMTYVPQGVTVRRGGAIFIADSRNERPVEQKTLRAAAEMLGRLADTRRLRVFYGVYDLTAGNEETWVSTEEIARCCAMTEETVAEILYEIPVLEENGKYRLDGNLMHIAPMLKLIVPN